MCENIYVYILNGNQDIASERKKKKSKINF